MFLGYPLHDWFAFFEAVEMLFIVFVLSVIGMLHFEEVKSKNKNRFIR